MMRTSFQPRVCALAGHDVRARAACREGARLIQIPADDAYVVPAEGLCLGGGANQTAHLVAALEQRSNEVGTDEPRSAGDERLHSVLS